MTEQEKVMFDDIIEEMELVYRNDETPWLIGYSGGKDSTMLVKLVFKMVENIPVGERKKDIYIITSDTMVENPIVAKYMHDSSASINQHSMNNNLKIKSVMVKPEISQTFWSLVIGLGYPTPEMPGFRWCTERLKINAMNDFTNGIIKKYGSATLLLGVRKGESTTRKKSIENKKIIGKLLNPHSNLKNTLVYNPLVDIPNRLVWEFILENDGRSEWGSDLKYLFNLYQGLDLGEEQSVLGEIDKDKIAVTGNSRFGCWCCTIVKEDKSLQNFINNGSTELVALRDFRNWLVGIRHDANFRDNKRRNGAKYVKQNGDVGLGPFTLNSRVIILRELLKIQRNFQQNNLQYFDYELITKEELKYIDTLWEEEGDLSRRLLVDVYFEVYGERLPWDKYKQPIYDEKVLEMLVDAATDAEIPFELISKLLTSIEKNKKHVKGNKLQNRVDSIIAQGWLHDFAIREGLNNEDK